MATVIVRISGSPSCSSSSIPTYELYTPPQEEAVPRPRWRRWALHPHHLLPSPGAAGLQLALEENPPQIVLVLAPPIPVGALANATLRDSVEVATALQDARLAGSSWRVHVIIPAFLDEAARAELADLYLADSVLHGCAAETLLQSAVSGNSNDDPAILWTGPLIVPSHNGAEPRVLPDFKLCSPEVTDGKDPLLTDGQLRAMRCLPARLLHTETSLPNAGAFLGARGSLRLRLALDAGSVTGDYFNEWYGSKLSCLIEIGLVRLWCFWAPTMVAGAAKWCCRVLVVPSLTDGLVDALDVAAFRIERVARACQITQPVKDVIELLPVVTIAEMLEPVSEEDMAAEVDDNRSQLALLATDRKRKRTDISASEGDGLSTRELKRTSAFFFPPSQSLEEISRLDRQVLRTMCLTRSKPHTSLPPEQPKARAVESSTPRAFRRQDNANKLEHKQASKQGGQTSLALRQSRYARLRSQKSHKITSRNGGKVDQNRHRLISTLQRGQVQPDSLVEKRTRQGELKGMHYFDTVGQKVLESLKESEPFFRTRGDPPSTEGSDSVLGPSSEQIAKTEMRRTPYDFEGSILSGEAFPRKGTHGVEYAHDLDTRDTRIRDLENVFSKSGLDFARCRDKEKQEVIPKLREAVDRLRSISIATKPNNGCFKRSSDDLDESLKPAGDTDELDALSPNPGTESSVARTGNMLGGMLSEASAFAKKTMTWVKQGKMELPMRQELFKTLQETMY